jgi:PTH1 family peptidyl-tRNA hydrolase
VSWYKEDPRNVVVLYDDVDLPVGKTRIRFGGGAGGHKGIQSIIDTLGTDQFLRFRLGIGYSMDEKMGKRAKTHMDEFVLAPFEAREKGKVHSMIKKVLRDIPVLLKHGYDAYVSKYNH